MKPALVLVPFLILACGETAGTDTGNPFMQPLAVDARSSDPGGVSIREDLGGIEVDQIWLGIDAVELYTTQDCSGSPAAVTPVLGVADHAEDERLEVVAEDVPETSYCKVSVPLILATDDPGIPAEVVGTSVFLSGSAADGTPFVIQSAAVDSIAVPAVNSDFDLAPDSAGDLLLAFDVAVWLEGLDFAGADRIDGTIVIGGGDNAALLNVFEGNLPAGVELFRDVNQDGDVSDPNDELLARGTP